MAKKALLRIVIERLQSLIQFIDVETDPELHPPGCWCHNLCGARKVWQCSIYVPAELSICSRSKGHEGYHCGIAPTGSSCSWKDPTPNAAPNYTTLKIKETS